MTTEMTPDTIAAFLKGRPTFLREHPELLELIHLPHTEGENVADLAAYQAKRLREQLRRTETRLKIVAKTSLANMQSVQQLHNLILGIVRATSFTKLQNSLKTDLQTAMDLTTAKLFIADGLDTPKTVQTMPASAIASLFGPNEAVVLRTLQTGDPSIYGKQAEKLASDALLLLQNAKGEAIGMLAIASSDQARFHEGMGSELLTFFAGVLGACVERLTEK